MDRFITDIEIVETLVDDSRTVAQRTAIARNILSMSEEEFDLWAAGELGDLRDGIEEQEREGR